jgi:hypothetical protein
MELSCEYSLGSDDKKQYSFQHRSSRASRNIFRAVVDLCKESLPSLQTRVDHFKLNFPKRPDKTSRYDVQIEALPDQTMSFRILALMFEVCAFRSTHALSPTS